MDRNEVRRTTAAVLLLALTATACGSGDSDTDGQGGKATASPSPSSTPATGEATASASGEPLSTKWQPRLKALGERNGVAVCQRPSSTTCAKVLGVIITDVVKLQQDIETGPGETVYRETYKQADKMTTAGDRYVTNGCEGDPAAEGEASLCHGLALDIASGLAILDLNLDTDEYRAGLR